MLQTQTVETGTLDLIKTLLNDAELSTFFLVGGTALSLQIGHRKSIDIDLFSTLEFDARGLASHLSRTYHAEEIRALKNGVFCFIEGIKIDLIAHQYPILYPLIIEDSIRMLSMEDIAAMKLNAILNSGSRLKDFIDMFFLLEKIPLETITTAFVQKYPDVNIQMAHNALLYHKDINIQEKIDFRGGLISLIQMEIRFREAIQKPLAVFEADLQKSVPLKRQR